MKKFAELFASLDQTTKTNEKVNLLKHYFSTTHDKDMLWALALFTNKKPRSQANIAFLKKWAAEAANIPDWIFEESYHVAGDLADTISLLLPYPISQQHYDLSYWIGYLNELSGYKEDEKKEAVLDAWKKMDQQERFVFIKLITGSFRIGVSHNLVIKAISEIYNLSQAVVAHRIMGKWSPEETTFEELLTAENTLDDISKPYPFFLAHPLDGEPEQLEDPHDWQVEWKWDGIRGEVIIRRGKLFVWSRGEELITDKFPEFEELLHLLPDGTVLDGEIMPYKNDAPLPFAILQTRIGRKNITKKILETAPVAFIAYDVLEFGGKDVREQPLDERRNVLETIVLNAPNQNILIISPKVEFHSWTQLLEEKNNCRQLLAEGFMLKRRSSTYKAGRRRGDWWKWKIDPLTVDGVLIYAQKGHGRRADLYTDYTFGVWDGDQLVPFAKAYSGLTDDEIREVDNFVKRNTKEKFGPVRTVIPKLVFEISFEGIRESTRHKSGIAVRFPRISRWRHNKTIHEANSLNDLKEMLKICSTGA